MRILLFILCVLSTFFNYSQNVKDEILNLNKAYSTSNDVGMETITRIFTEGSDKPSEETKTELYKLKGNYLSRAGSSETMFNKKFKINLDVNKKIIIIYSINKYNEGANSTKNFDEKAFKLSMDTMLNAYKEVNLSKVNENTNQVEFKFKSGIYNFIKVSYDTKTYRVKDCTIKLNPSQSNSKDKKELLKYVITYNYLSKDKLEKIRFNQSDYVIIDKDNNVLPALKYKGFTVINNIKKNSL